MSVRLKRPPKDGLVRAHPRLQLRASEPEEPDEVEEPDETSAEEAQEEAEERTLYGYFTLFNEPTEINSYYEGNFIERVAPGAFAKWIAGHRDAIRCLFQHGMDYQIGDKPLGPISELREDETGPYYEVPLLNVHYVRELIPGLEAALYGCSFRFRVIREEWDEEPEPSDDNPKGLPERTLLELQVPEFGPVTFPAYPGATAALRSMTDDYLARRFLQDPEGLEETLAAAADPGRLAELFAARGVRSVPRTLPQRSESESVREEPETPAEEDTETEGREAPETAETEGAEPEATAEPDTAPPERAASRGRRDTPEASTAAAKTRSKENRMTIEELRARLEEIRTRLTEIDGEHRDAELPEATQTEYDELESERATVEASIERIEKRQENVRSLARHAANREGGDGTFRATPDRPADPYDVSEILSRARGASSESERQGIMRDSALRAVDEEKVFFHERVDIERAKEHIDFLLRREAMLEDSGSSPIAERILRTGSEKYQRSFMKAIAGAPLTSDEQRALATFTGNAGGFAVPYQLDPTLIPTSNFSVNPFRQIARVEKVLTNEWKGVTTGAVAASYAGEGAEVGDGTPTLGQPTANPERCHAFVPFTYELEQDWAAALTEMAGLIAEGKDDIEAVKFLEGAGHGSKEPEGLLTAIEAAQEVAAGGTKAFAIADFYKLEEALPPRFRPRAQFLGNRFVYNKIRQFDTAGGAALWVWLREGLGNNVPTPGNVEAKLAGYPVNEVSSMAASLETGSKILVIGDFRYLLIAERIGMNVEVVNNLFGANRRPTGERGLYAFWRNTSKVLSPKAFRVLKTS
jgi:HK97 family phage major capsid protein/HK97 family phage prohead protease